jgi:aryl-alcohol dehydrogenase-like predicted oxidoreductase
MNKRLILGTANFGLEYGIANKKKLGEDVVHSILEKAYEMGVATLDTASGYGDAEKVIGDFFRKKGKCFEVITKLPAPDYRSPDDVKREIDTSLDNMSVDSIDYLLLHSYGTYEEYGKTVFPVLNEYKEQGIIGHIGISVYHPYEIDNVLEKGHGISSVELPLNMFDRRFIRHDRIPSLIKKNIRVFARSVFLQGLFFIEDSKIDSFFNPVKGRIKRIREISEAYQITIESMAISFVLSHGVDGIVLGVDSVEQLEKNISYLDNLSIEDLSGLKKELEPLEVLDEDIILPYKWTVA